MTLTEFLLARIAEDEVVARAAAEGRSGSGAQWELAGGRSLRYDNGAGESVYAVRVDHPAGPWERIYVKRDPDGRTTAHIARHDPARVLAECEAKRRIVSLEPCLACDVEGQPCDHKAETLRALAAPYADHPDYDPSWRP